METALFGDVLIQRKLATRSQLAKALDAQRTSTPRRLLGDVLLDQGVLSVDALDSILGNQMRTVELSRAQSRYSLPDLQAKLKDAALSGFLQVARELGAAALLLTPSLRPALRLHGNLVDLPVDPLSPARVESLLGAALDAAGASAQAKGGSVDVVVQPAGLGRFRANVFRHVNGLAGVFHVIPEEAWGFDRVGLPSVVRSFVDFNHGLVLFAGPMGSGKSTSLASLVDLINKTQKVHVVTFEDPIEVLHRSDQALISQREVRRHTPSFTAGLRGSLRTDPDVMVVGELADAESTAMAISASETGHLVFGTLHTSSAVGTVMRLLDQFPAQKRAHIRSMLAGTLRAVVCQQLLPTLDGKGRALACEILVVTPAVANLIREDRVWQIPMSMQTGAQEGMVLMDESLRQLVRAKRVSLADALARAADRESFLR